MAELCRALLRAGKFSLAKSYLQGTGSVQLEPQLVRPLVSLPRPIPCPSAPLFFPHQVETVIVRCGREYLCNATSMNSPEVQSAQACFALLPPGSTAAEGDAKLIKLLTRLPAFGVSRMPHLLAPLALACKLPLMSSLPDQPRVLPGINDFSQPSSASCI